MTRSNHRVTRGLTCHTLRVRIDNSMYNQLKNWQDALGERSLSEVVRLAIDSELMKRVNATHTTSSSQDLDHIINSTSAIEDLVTQIRYIGNNINQIARHLNQQRNDSVDFDTVKMRTTSLLEKYQNILDELEGVMTDGSRSSEPS